MFLAALWSSQVFEVLGVAVNARTLHVLVGASRARLSRVPAGFPLTLRTLRWLLRNVPTLPRKSVVRLDQELLDAERPAEERRELEHTARAVLASTEAHGDGAQAVQLARLRTRKMGPFLVSSGGSRVRPRHTHADTPAYVLIRLRTGVA